MSSQIRFLSALVCLVSILCLTSCFEPPIIETLTLRFTEDGSVALSVSCEIKNPDRAGSNPHLQQRLKSIQKAILEGWDPWSRRFDALSPQNEQVILEKEKGQLIRHVRTVLLKDPAELEDFFSYTDLNILFKRYEDYCEFGVYPAASTRATGAQVKNVKEYLDVFSRQTEDYYRFLKELYLYLDEHPERAEICFGNLLETLLSPEEKETLKEPSDDEKEILENLYGALEDIVSVLVVPDEEAYSMNELSRLVYNPFPANFQVEVPGSVIEYEGFSNSDSNRFSVEGMSIWDGFEIHEETWCTPNPVVTYVKGHLNTLQKRFDLSVYSSLPRDADNIPDSQLFREELISVLSPYPTYRVRWAVPLSRDEWAKERDETGHE